MEFAALHCKFQTKKVHIVGPMMAEIAQILGFQDVILWKAKFVKEQMFHSVLHKITKHVYKIWDISAIIHMITLFATSIMI